MAENHEPTPMPMTDTPQQSPEILIGQLKIPLPMFIGTVLFLIASVTTGAFTWARTSGHAEDRTVHLEAAASLRGGGPAYKNDLRVAYLQTRRLLKSMTLMCRQDAQGAFSCKIDLPEPGDQEAQP